MATKRSRSLKLDSKAGNITANATVIASANINAGTGNGYAGSRGYTGSSGYTGSAGAGYTGSSAAGYTGSAGPAGGYTGSRGDTGYVGSIGGFNSLQVITPIVSNLYTLVAADAGTLLSFTGNTTNSLIVPTDANALIGVGTRIDVTQASAGPVIVSADTGVTLHSVLGAYLNDPSSVGTLIKIGADEWTFVGPQSAGYTGSASTVIGYTGSQGESGYTGSLGYSGSQGLSGYSGSRGDTGYVGSTGVGYTGSSGSASAAGGDTQVQFNDAGTIGGDSGLTFNKTTSTLTSDNVAILGSVTEQVYTITDGASVDIDPANGTIQVWTLSSGRTPTATNFANGQSITLMLNSGANAVTWTSVAVTWVGGTPPTLSSTGYNVIDLWKIAGTVYGASIGTV